MPSTFNSRKRSLPEGFMCFSLGGSSPAQRSSYSDKRRQQVHEVRKVGACLRCQLLKKSCSKGEPCTTCIRAAAKTSASRSLAWMSCLRPSLCNLTIYGSTSHYNPDLKLGGVPVLQYLAHGDVDLKFDIPFQWNIDELSTFVAGWLANDHDAPRASMVGIMSSASLLSVISDLVGSELAQVFKALIYTSSIIFNSSNDQHTYSDQSTDIKVLRHCGQRLLEHLDSQIRPTTLARLKKHELYAIFLLLLGCIISSKYVFESLGDLSRLTFGSMKKTTRQQVQPSIINSADANRGSELVRLLSHQMVYIGQTTGLIEDGAENGLITDLTSLRWRRRALFTWDVVEDHEVGAARSDCDNDSRASNPLTCEHRHANPIESIQVQPTQAACSSYQQHPLDRQRRKHKSDASKRLAATRLRRLNACVSCQVDRSTSQPTHGQSLCRRCSDQQKARSSAFQVIAPVAGGIEAHIPHPVLNTLDVLHMCATPSSPNTRAVRSPTRSRMFSCSLSGFARTQSSEEFQPFYTQQMRETLPDASYSTGGIEIEDTDHWMTDSLPHELISSSRDGSNEYMPTDVTTVLPSSPLDFSIAAFDPDLPTFGLDNTLFQDDVGQGFAFQSRMPTPPPMDVDSGLQQQLKEIGDRFQSLHDMNLSETDTKVPVLDYLDTAATRSGCFHGPEAVSTSLHNDLFVSRQRRLLL